MGLKALISVPYSSFVCNKNKRWINNPIDAQKNIFKELINSGKNTAFGKDHNFSTINDYSEFKKNVPIRDYEELRVYVERTLSGEKDVLWKGKPLYFCKKFGVRTLWVSAPCRLALAFQWFPLVFARSSEMVLRFSLIAICTFWCSLMFFMNSLISK